MRPIVLFPKSKNTERPPSWLESYQQRCHRLLNDKPVPKPAARNATRAKSIQSVSRSGTKQTKNMTEKTYSEETPLANSVVTVTLKPCKSQNGVNEYSCQVISEVANPESNGKAVDAKPEKTKLDQNQTKDKRISIDLSLEKLRDEMNSLRKQDVELLDQLLTLNDSIQDFKLTQQACLYDSLSNLSEISDESDRQEWDQPMLSTDFQSIKTVPPTHETESLCCENLVSKVDGLEQSCVIMATKERIRVDSCYGRDKYRYTFPAEKAKRCHSQLSLKSESTWTNGNEEREARRASEVSHGAHCSYTGRKTGKQKCPLNEIKLSASKQSSGTCYYGSYGTSSCDKSEAKQNFSNARHLTSGKSHVAQLGKQNSKEIERSLSQTSLVSDCSGYGTGSSEKLSSRSESPACTASENRHKNASYYFSPLDEQTARWAGFDCFTDHAPKSFGADAIYKLGPPVQKNARSSSLCCVAEHGPDPRGDEMVYHFVTPVKKTSQSTSLNDVMEYAPDLHGPSFVVSAGIENKEMCIRPSVTLKCCSGVRYAATRPLRSFTKRQSTIW